MIKIKCLNKQTLFFFVKYAGKENCTKIFYFNKQIKKSGWKVTGAGGDENLKNYLAWP